MGWKTMLTAVTGTTVLVVLLCLSATTPSSHRRLGPPTPKARAAKLLRQITWDHRQQDDEYREQLRELIREHLPEGVQDAINEKIKLLQDKIQAEVDNDVATINIYQGEITFLQGLPESL